MHVHHGSLLFNRPRILDKANKIVPRIRAVYHTGRASAHRNPQPTPPSGVWTAPLPARKPEMIPQTSTTRPSRRHQTSRNSGGRERRAGCVSP